MRRFLALLVLVGCGNVTPTPGRGPDGGPGGDGGADVPPGKVVWQKDMGGTFLSSLAVVGDDLYVGAGLFSALTLGADNLVPAGAIDELTVHLTTDGALKSAWRHGSASNEQALGFAIDPTGNTSVAALYNGPGVANFGGADLPAAPNNGFEAVAASYGDAGNLRWLTPLASDILSFPGSASTNSTGLTAVTGRFMGTLTVGGSHIVSAGSNDVFFATFDDKGNVGTLAGYGGPGDDQGTGALFDGLGGVVLVGSFSGQISFGTFTLDAGDGSDVYVVRMTPQGTPMWAIQGATAEAGMTSVAITPGGDVVLAAAYKGTFQLTGGDQVTSAGDFDFALSRISSAGKVLWTESFGGPGPDFARHIAVGRHDEIAVSGEFVGQAAVGGDIFTSAGGQDAFVAKYTGGGAHVWSHATGSAGVDRGLGIAVDATGAVYAGLSFHNTIDLGGGPVTAAGTDYAGALFKLSP